MKKTICLILAVFLAVSLTACRVGDVDVVYVPREDSSYYYTDFTTNAPDNDAPPTAQTLTIPEFDALLAEQSLGVISIEIVSTDSEYLTTYRHVAVCKIKNNTDVDIRDIKLAYVAWDIDNLPVKSTMSNYLQTITIENVNLIAGAVYDANAKNIHNHAFTIGGWSYDCSFGSKNDPVNEMKAIVVSYTDYNGTTWTNPYFRAFKNAFEGKKYNYDMVIEIGE